MPPSANIHVDEETYVDILSFVLRTNGFPVGDDALTTAALATVLIQGEQGPEEVPDHSLVQVTGCLSRDADNIWIVTGATEPTRTRNPDPSVGGDREAARSRAGGSASFQLLYVFPSPDAMAGHLVEAKGFLIRGEPDALNVTAVSALGPTCR